MKLLAVDDDEIALELLASTLRNGGYEDIIAVTSADDALRHLGSGGARFDCLLVDICMPGKDGIELVREVRAMPCHANTPIIMVTAVTDQKSLRQALEAGATDYVNKPLNGVELGTEFRTVGALAQVLEDGVAVTEYQTNQPDRGGCALYLSDPVTLELAPGIVGFEKLRSGLLALPSGPYSMAILAIAIMDIEETFLKASAVRYRAYLNDIASTVKGLFPAGEVNIAYAGNGVFAIVLHKSRVPNLVHAKRRIRERLNRYQQPHITAHRCGIAVKFGNAAKSSTWTGNSAAIALTKACHDAHRKVEAANDHKKTESWRKELGTIQQKRYDSMWLTRHFQGINAIVNRIVPRRVVTGTISIVTERGRVQSTAVDTSQK